MGRLVITSENRGLNRELRHDSDYGNHFWPPYSSSHSLFILLLFRLYLHIAQRYSLTWSLMRLSMLSRGKQGIRGALHFDCLLHAGAPRWGGLYVFFWRGRMDANHIITCTYSCGHLGIEHERALEVSIWTIKTSIHLLLTLSINWWNYSLCDDCAYY